MILDSHRGSVTKSCPFKLDMLQSGTIQVRSVLGPDVPVTDTEIEESLWHYYYDVEKTINYILSSASCLFT